MSNRKTYYVSPRGNSWAVKAVEPTALSVSSRRRSPPWTERETSPATSHKARS